MVRFHVRADPEQGNLLPQPTVCPAPTSDKGTPPGPSPGNAQGGRGGGRKGGGKGKGGGSDKGCTSYSLREIESSGEVVDYQVHAAMYSVYWSYIFISFASTCKGN